MHAAFRAVFCSRCLFHINGAETVDEAEGVNAFRAHLERLRRRLTGTVPAKRKATIPRAPPPLTVRYPRDAEMRT